MNKEQSSTKSVSKWKTYYSKAMLFWIPVSYLFLLLQIIEIYSKQSAKNVSLPAYIIYVVSSVFWFIYGTFVLKHKSYPIILSSCLAFSLGLTLLIGIILYK